MDIFGGALSSIAGGVWSNLTMPAMGSVNIPAMGQVNMPAMGSVNMPAMGSVNMPAMGNVSWTQPTTSFAPGISEINQGFGSGVNQVVGGVTGTSNEIIVGQSPYGCNFINVPNSFLEAPGYGRNPFPGYGSGGMMPGYAPPNMFFAAQFFGGCNSFYSGFGGMASMFFG